MTIKPVIVSTMVVRRFVLANLGVCAKAGCASNTLVAPVERLMPPSAECGRMLVSISLDALVEPSAVLESLLTDDESVTRGVPSARQKASVSSPSTRSHAGQRFKVLGTYCFSGAEIKIHTSEADE